MRLIDADALWKEFCRSEAIEERYGSGVLEIAGSIIENAPTIDAVPRWIPCEERLPKNFDYVLVTIKHKNEKPKTSRARWTNARWIGCGQMTDVIAWMPLPEPYEGERKDDE